MSELFHIKFITFTVVDLIDILIMAFVFYRILLLVRGTRAAEMVMGAITIIILAFAALWFNLTGLSWLVRGGAFFGVIILVIVFQPELRGLLASLGRNPWTAFLSGLFMQASDEGAAAPITEAAVELSQRGYGALIVIEQEVGLRSVIDTGRMLEASLTSHMLVTVFTPHTPIHDGAAVVRGDVVVAAGCVLPMTTDSAYRDLIGMRHRAAVGVTEETDAVVVVVSEETGAISLAFRGQLYRDFDEESLRRELSSLFRKPAVWKPRWRRPMVEPAESGGTT
jgi:diadenylate cyclase